MNVMKMNHNPQQAAALSSNSNNILVVAGPGSGKTSLLVEAVAQRCERYGAERVLCITFTTAGAAEMRKRLEARGVKKVGFIGTLHSFLLRLLRSQFKLAGLNCPPTVIDDDAADLILEQAASEVGCKASSKSLQETLKSGELKLDSTGIAITEYRRRLLRDGLLTNDMVLAYGERLMKTIEGERKSWGEVEWFPWVDLFVDEVQDSADIDFRIYNLMPVETRFYVGDPDQAIYGFRGGNVKNMLGLDFDLFPLETNYRCESKICEAAQRLIDRNNCRFLKKTVAAGIGGIASSHESNSPVEEMHFVAGQIAAIQKVHETVPCAESVAVICRTNRQAGEFRDFLRAAGIQLAEPKKQPSVEGWLAARLLVSALAAPHSDTAWLALVEAALGKQRAAEVRKNAAAKMISAREAALSLWPDHSLPALSKLLPFEAREKLHAACREVADGNPDWTLPELAAYLSRGEAREESAAGVHVLTAHASKGREFDSVFIVGLEEGSFPQAKKDTDVEEERRLMFVAMTRARYRLTLSWCNQRPQSRGPNLPPGPLEEKAKSRFVSEAGF